MTQEEKQFLFRDLCARLPYGLIVQETFRDVQRDVPAWDCGPHYIKDNLEKVKPYLRSMSSMTEEEKCEFNSYYNMFNNNPVGLIDWLNAHHFDYHRLIEKGLALEAPNDMYK